MSDLIARRDPPKRLHVVGRHTKDDLEDMRRKADELFKRAADVEKRVKNEEPQPGYKRKSEVEYWLREVEKMKDKKQVIEGQVKGEASSSHHDLKKQVVEFTNRCTDLLQPSNLPDELTLCDLKLVTTPMKGGLFKKNLEQVLSWLDDDAATSIGVYGMGGVGKTTLAKHVHNQLRQRFNNGKCSGYVYWVTVSHGVTLSSLQSKIANQVELDGLLRGKDEVVSAAIIKDALKRRGSCVLILDDMWEPFPAEEIGIPIGEDGFKLLVTARSKDVCRRLGLKETINVKCLTDDESWDLFREKLVNSLTQEDEDIARMVAECKGLPIAIVTIASSMRGEYSIREWRNLLKQLQQLTTRQQEVVEEKVLPLLQLSYDRLGKSQLKDCFLCCAFYLEDHNVWVEHELIACWTREGLLEGIESREERRDEGHSIVNRLVNACLLEYNDDKDGVKMHDLVREMAVKVCRGKHFLIRAREEMEDIPPEEEWTVDLCKVSLMSNDIKSISPVEPPNCPNLKTLLLGWNRGLKSISSNFFSHLTSLRVVDLSWTGIESIPESISGLVNLTALLLRECWSLTDLPSLSNLQKLRELDLRWSGIKSLPESISDLVNLTELLLDDCNSLTYLPSLSKLHKLTKLYLRGLRNLKSIRSGLTLRCLTISNCEALEEVIGGSDNNVVDQPRYLPNLGYLWLEGLPNLKSIRSGGLSNLQELKVYNCGGLKWLFTPTMVGNLQNLSSLSISSCWTLEEVISGSDNDVVDQPRHLPKLEYLYLNELPNLKSIRSGLSNLRELGVKICDGLKWLFTPTMACNLQNLSELSISNCEALEEVIRGSDNDVVDQPRYLPKLGYLYLNELPNLKKICPAGESDLVNLTDLLVYNCGDLADLPSLSKLQKLTKLDLSHTGIKSLPESISDLVNLRILEIRSCDGLKWLFTPTMACNLQNLEDLTILECEALEEVIGGSDNDVVDQPRYLPELKHLLLYRLPNLKSIRSGGLSNLRELGVMDCRGLKCLFTPTMAGNLQNLGKLSISNCMALEEVIGGSDNDVVDQPKYLPKLKYLYLVHLPNLKSIRSGLSNLQQLGVKICYGLKWLFTPTMACNLQNQSELSTSNCEALEEVIGGSDNDVVDQPRYLPKLEKLYLEGLPNLKRICPVGNVGCDSTEREVEDCPILEW